MLTQLSLIGCKFLDDMNPFLLSSLSSPHTITILKVKQSIVDLHSDYKVLAQCLPTQKIS
jgi:hypothetical protein